ncbi:penicillin acylase family protein [Bryobacter aggregatus]|uniref:penicillin acylase family protein n=1 Tax=Bryobacter aggregatus TaxID=360054 RepID=UPI0004E22789|nr:penicillin acylase family protein [Bryobacter aggregatus]
MRRVFKYTNAIAAIALIAALGLFYKYIWLSMPQTAGELALDLSKPATVTRDDRGIPHIQAASIEDALYLQGYVHAQDRFWQMDATRRIAAGEMAEIVGQAALESDIDSRRMRLRRLAESMQAQMEPEDRKWLAAYARGVNDWLNTHLDTLPLEIRALNYTPRQWSINDSLLLGLHMHRQLSTSWTTEADQFLMLAQGGDPAKVKMLFPTRNGAEIMMGSNAWAISGTRSSTGKPILAGDPHLQQSWPSTFYINHLKAGDLDVIGGSIPGSPGVIIGHNQKIAWSMTTLQFDVQDLYINESRLVGIEKETIRIKGGGVVEFNNQITPHGPIVERNGIKYALQWTPFDGKFSFAFLDINRAQDWTQFRKALSRFPGPNHNFLYADQAGNIGYQAAGRFPIRKTAESGLPLDARNPDHEWLGFIPFEELPTAFNPKSGYLVSSNQNPFPKDYKYPVAGIFTPPYRQRQIVNRLGEKAQWLPVEMASIQKDVYSAFHHYLAQELVKAGRKRKSSREEFSAALEVLESWNGQMEIGMAAPLLATLAYEQLKTAVLHRASPRAPGTPSHFAPSVVEDLLRSRPKDWFADYDQLLIQALLDALEIGVKQQGKNPKFWDYGRYNRIYIPNQVLAEAVTVGKFVSKPWMPMADVIRALKLPLVDSYVQAGPAALSGSALTVKQVSPRVGPAFRFIADPSNWEKSYFTLTLGESGHVFAKHSKDYWESWYNGEPVLLPYQEVRADEVLRIRPR